MDSRFVDLESTGFLATLTDSRIMRVGISWNILGLRLQLVTIYTTVFILCEVISVVLTLTPMPSLLRFSDLLGTAQHESDVNSGGQEKLTDSYPRS